MLLWSSEFPVSLRVNGRPYDARAGARTTLLDWLREGALLTGTKKGCNEGACGTCTVLIDGKRMNACLTLLAQCEGREASPIGAKGIGELGATGVDAAVAAAIHDAVGVRVRELPILPWKILAGLADR